MVAAGLSGPRRPWAGSVRDYVLGTRLISGHGHLLRFGGEVMKNVAGYDLDKLQGPIVVRRARGGERDRGADVGVEGDREAGLGHTVSQVERQVVHVDQVARRGRLITLGPCRGPALLHHCSGHYHCGVLI